MEQAARRASAAADARTPNTRANCRQRRRTARNGPERAPAGAAGTTTAVEPDGGITHVGVRHGRRHPRRGVAAPQRRLRRHRPIRGRPRLPPRSPSARPAHGSDHHRGYSGVRRHRDHGGRGGGRVYRDDARGRRRRRPDRASDLSATWSRAHLAYPRSARERAYRSHSLKVP